MSNEPAASELAALTPCIGTCRLDARGLCIGCLRTGEEIGRWRNMSNAERLRLMEIVLPGRKSS